MTSENQQAKPEPATIDHLDPVSRWNNRLFVDGFKSVQDSVPQAKCSRAEVSDERCIELAGLQELYVDHWIELVGVGLGQHHLYDISAEGVSFRKHEKEYISECPAEWQADMTRDNRVAPQLDFPCTPNKMLDFFDALSELCNTAVGIHCFALPDAFRLEVTRGAQIERCNELASLPELRVHHWRELTGVGICEGISYAVNQDGVFPKKHSDRDLQGLTQEEFYILVECSSRLQLEFPCTPSQLVKFVDGDLSRGFEVPDYFRMAVEARALLLQNDSEQNTPSGWPESDAPPAPVATLVGWIELVRAIALEYIAKHKASDLFPSQRDVCEHVEKEARARKIYGPQGTPISAKYIQRNAIQGEWWKRHRP